MEDSEREVLHGTYVTKLPDAAQFLERPGVLTYVLVPEKIVFARGFKEHFELDFSPAQSSG